MQGRFAGFSVGVSEYEETGYHTCFDYGKNGPLPNLLIAHNASCTPPAEGRYVMITNNRNDGPYGAGYSSTAFVNLCEVEIFVEECGNNTFGENCSETCGKCKENLCHYVTGTCLQGCQDGWSSLLCDIGSYVFFFSKTILYAFPSKKRKYEYF
ncbi:hypothetical protein FSP39_005593 [Pinctada imbricata]|uniref:Uncharacterized protein n=1 Tax=Pinctada imbricata TaxID=66713 RepID=A0AA88Y536_PINIB|nr:hypothetical protein FSP39_005593 [Pinctada imbricata]